jgi:triacylglycerol lipase
LKAVDPKTGLSGDQFLSERLSANPDLDVKVIGHSLGGATAPIMAMWIRSEFPQVDARPFPFGGQTPGNAQFAQWYGDAFPKVPTRYLNDLDLCPLMFSELSRIKTIWGTEVPCPDYVKAALDYWLVEMEMKGIAYATTDRAHVYEGKMYNVSGPWAWEHEASAQHEHLYYMFNAGIALSVIRKGLGPTWSPPPGTGPCG